MSAVRLIARDELRLMRRNRVAVIAFALLALLTLIAAMTSWTHQQGVADLRARFQSEADQAFDAQPDRHPHRVVHYGHFIFRPLGPLAAFDPGVDAFTGNSMFLEGHRQNTANFGDVRQSSQLIRFGQLTPALPTGYGFTAIIVAFLGRLHPVGAFFGGLVLALTYLGGEKAQIALGLPAAVTMINQGILLFYLLACDLLIRYRLKVVMPARKAA